MERPQWQDDQLVVMREKDDEEYEIDQDELQGYAEHIGIRLPGEEMLLDIAREGLQEKLPEEWEACLCPDDSTVYRRKATGQLQYEHPLDEKYRQIVLEIRSRLMNEQQYSQSSQLSEIAEDEDEMANDSEVYERQKAARNYDNLRLPISELGIRQLNEAHQRHPSKYSENSILDRNISMEQTDTLSRKELPSNRVLPSSLLQNYKSLQQAPSLEQYQTEFTQKVGDNTPDQSECSRSLGQKLKVDQEALKQELSLQIEELKRQEQLKLQLLANLEKSNKKLFDQIQKKMKHKRKGNGKQKEASHHSSRH